MPFRDRNPCVYILASRRNGTLYTGVTSDLFQRMPQHKRGLVEGSTKKYRVHMLAYNETHPTMAAAIRREKRIKEWRRQWKIRLIESMDPEWVDLFDERTGQILDGPRGCLADLVTSASPTGAGRRLRAKKSSARVASREVVL